MSSGTSKQELIEYVSQAVPKELKETYNVSDVRILEGEDNEINYSNPSIVGSYDRFNKKINWKAPIANIGGYETHWLGQLHISSFPLYCGAYLISNLNRFSGIHELIAVRALLMLYNDSRKGDYLATKYIIQYFRPRFVMLDAQAKVYCSSSFGFPVLKSVCKHLDLGVNNNSGNHTGLWVADVEHLIEADRILTEKYIPKVEDKPKEEIVRPQKLANSFEELPY